MLKTLISSLPWNRPPTEDDDAAAQLAERLRREREVVGGPATHFRIYRAVNGFVLERTYPELHLGESNYELRVVANESDLSAEIVASLASLKLSGS